jgi:ABC-type Na+ efflux pump permease subunit
VRQVWRLALNDLRLTVKDRPAAFWLLLFPVFLMWVFGRMGGGPPGTPRVAMAVIDEDGGWLARAFVGELRGERLELRETTRREYEASDERVRCLVIPPGFTAGVLAGAQQRLRLEREGGSSEAFGLAGQAAAVRASARTLGRLVQMRHAGEGAEAALAEFEALAEAPRAVSLRVSAAGSGRPVPRGYAQSVPGMLTMIVLMMTLIYGAVFLTIEKRDGMLRRQASLPLGRGRIFVGKLAGRLLIAALQILLLLGAGRWLFGVSWGGSPAGLALVLGAYAVAVAALATLLGAVLRSPQQASVVGWLASMLLAGLGGCWWPSEVEPAWLRTAAHVLPTAWAMDGLHALVSFGRGVEAALVPAAALLGFGAAFALLGARLLRFEG